MAENPNRLDRGATIKIVLWVQNNQKMLTEEKPTFRAISKLITGEVGFHVSPGTAASVVREIIPDYSPKDRGKTGGGARWAKWRATVEQKINDLETQMIRLMERLDKVERPVHTNGPMPLVKPQGVR